MPNLGYACILTALNDLPKKKLTAQGSESNNKPIYDQENVSR